MGNTNNEQMAGGMAMSGRRLQPLEKLRAIRDRYRRKFDTKWQNVPEGLPPPAEQRRMFREKIYSAKILPALAIVR